MPAVVTKNSSAAMKRPPEGLFSIVASCREGHFSSHLQRASSTLPRTSSTFSRTLSTSSPIRSLICLRSSAPDWGVKSIVRADPIIKPPTSDTMTIPVFFIVIGVYLIQPFELQSPRQIVTFGNMIPDPCTTVAFTGTPMFSICCSRYLTTAS